MGAIFNAANRPLNESAGTVPDVSGALLDYFQPMVFTRIVKSVVSFQAVETPTPINFRGMIQPLHPAKLDLKPEGQRTWKWFQLHADLALDLDTDEVATYLGVQTRVMAKADYRLYGYRYFEIVQDWTGAGP